jgi:hypothetical protein
MTVATNYALSASTSERFSPVPVWGGSRSRRRNLVVFLRHAVGLLGLGFQAS